MNVIDILGYQPTIYIDDGHGENTAGKRTPKMDDGKIIKENQFNKPTAMKFGKAAEQMGFRVFYVAPEDSDTTLKIRTDRSNADYKQQRMKYPNVPKEKLALYISFHYNAYDGKFDTNSGGVETFYCPGSDEGKQLATTIQKHLIQGISQINRGVKSANFHVLRETSMVAVLIEAGFMDVREEAALMLNENFQSEVATETLKGVCDYYGVPYNDDLYPENTPEWKKELMEWLFNEKLLTDEEWKKKVDEPFPAWAVASILKQMKERF